MKVLWGWERRGSLWGDGVCVMEGVNKQRIALFVCVWDCGNGGLIGKAIALYYVINGGTKSSNKASGGMVAILY